MFDVLTYINYYIFTKKYKQGLIWVFFYIYRYHTTYKNMTLVLNYKLNELATLTVDATGNGNTLTNVNALSTVVDTTYGETVNFTAAQAYFELPTIPATLLGASSRTYSVWVNYVGGSYHVIHGQGSDSDEYRVQFSPANRITIASSGGDVDVTSSSPTLSTWHHIAITYDGTTEVVYVDGAVENTRNTALNSSGTNLFIGGSPKFVGSFTFYGKMLDFRVYDDAISAGDASTLFSSGPNAAPPLLIVTPGVLNIATEWPAVDLATGYRLTTTTGGGPEITRVTTPLLLFDIGSLTPGTLYDVKLYSTADSVAYTLVETISESTKPNLSTNYDTNDFSDGSGGFDLSMLSTASLDLVLELMNDLFATGDKVDLTIAGRTLSTTMVKRGGTVTIPSDNSSISIPFNSLAGSSQSVTLTLSNATTVGVTYDELSGKITVPSGEYGTGESFLLDGQKVTIVDI